MVHMGWMHNSSSLALTPLDVLKKGLDKFTETLKTCKNKLSAKLARAK
jgi:hypothetical protein